MKKEIKILGAGISGLSAAINLAKAGYDVKVYEKNSDCGQRFHGDFQGLENWSVEKNVLKELREMNIKTNFKNWPIKKMNFIDYKDEKFHASSGKILAYFVKRGCFENSLDISLKKQALDSGVQIFFNKTINEENADIIATGPKKAAAVVRGISFDANHKNIFVTQFNDKTSYKGYSYMLLIDGHGTIVTGLAERFKKIDKEFKGAKDFFLKHHNLKLKNVKEWGNYANFSINGPYKYKKKLYVGEAAGLQDGLFGFGMRSAFVSGYLAAKSIIKRKNYKKLIKKRYSNYLKNGIVNRYLWERLGNKGYEKFLKILKIQGNLFKLLNYVYKYSFFKKLVFPIAYHKLKRREK
tara:strand:+ start:56 stop:1111 length:1056 start_codon:yes stop_codon:yes gene_type:complete